MKPAHSCTSRISGTLARDRSCVRCREDGAGAEIQDLSSVGDSDRTLAFLLRHPRAATCGILPVADNIRFTADQTEIQSSPMSPTENEKEM